MKAKRTLESRRRSEGGHLMAGVVVLIAVMMIMSTVAVQGIHNEMQREKEAELIFRGEEIARAILRFQQSQGRLPLRMEELTEPGPNGEYFLRKLYEDPFAKDGKWGLLYQSPGGGIIDPSQGDSLDPAANGPGGGQIGGVGGFQNSVGNNANSRLNDAFGGSGNNNNQRDRSAPGGQGAPQTGLGGIGNDSSRDSLLNPGGAGGPGGQGAGLPIAGVKTLYEETPFRLYNDLTEYRQWLFTYLEAQNQQQRRAGVRTVGDPNAPGAQGLGNPGLNNGRGGLNGGGLNNRGAGGTRQRNGLGGPRRPQGGNGGGGRRPPARPTTTPLGGN